MEIKIHWNSIQDLRDGSNCNLIYMCDLDQITEEAGVYVFGRLYGERVDPIYIGESQSVRKRVGQHLERVSLMKAIEGSKAGRKVLLTGTLATGKGLQKKKTLKRVERALIKAALAQGAELVNWHGTRTPYDTIAFDGNQFGKRLFGREMHVEK